MRTLLATVQGFDVAYLSPLEMEKSGKKEKKKKKKKKKTGVIDEAGRRSYVNYCRQIFFMENGRMEK